MFRYVVATTPDRMPSACKNCGAGTDREWYLDFSYIEDFYGAVYLCNACCDELARAIGYAPTSEIRAKYEMALADSRAKDVYVSIYNRLFGPGVSAELVLELLSLQDAGEIQERTAKLVANRAGRDVKSSTGTRSIGLSSSSGSNTELELG